MNRPPAGAPVATETRFRWRAVDAHGSRKTGALIAPDAGTARALLKRENLFVVDLRSEGPAPRAKASAAEVTLFTRQLASLLRAGLPLAPALDLLAQPQNARRAGMPRIVGTLARDITAGLRFSAALQRHPAQFNALYCQLVEVGEAAGALPAVLARIADDRERAAAQRAKVRAALTYPLAILLLALAITAALLVWVVPTFKQIFDGFGARLPAPTLFVLALSAGVARWSVPAVALVVAAGSAATFLLRRSEPARIRFARLSLKMPVAGTLLATLCAARWSRALGTLLSAGTPLADAFDSLTHATGNASFDRATVDIAARLRRGERLAAAMRAARCFPAEVVQPIAVAEESGAIDTMLLDVASLADRQVDEKIGTLSSLCEPLVIIVLGALVGGLVIAMYLPIIQLGNVV
ncbi:type II secretion system F family protein [bacterium M00.F.Ca.ET.228.01.1.1]|uniref:type II secretion system F family protein n=1 Tax=Paraburkholderia phenoliruptrix TaxID=252970 RepID=UPI00109308F8|nr:type II secretion system F family protein [Paraburkholderia phenoliruptrix]TGP44246.1 type II secretion system F family protein [bacterium M00.F.Ca.ET.228.01.1.1]TGS01909.1 type II secretion system F family protein [bacterium M00.F.Ca.ET.191.01.1.1]TGU08486.1 type II secretion system F family protein [bacterium M00.F.Ca.ET.155.01.1.1]MBW0450029.1 type II secretion system F family protein [Paraburkholderia phenoliruptrix]MBW9101549.1 type II secretion system F family protein [Paraburkholderi